MPIVRSATLAGSFWFPTETIRNRHLSNPAKGVLVVGYSLSLEGEVTREQIMALSPKDNPNVIKRCFCELEAAGHLEYYSQYGDYGLKNKIRFHPIPIPAEERTNRTHWKKKEKKTKKQRPYQKFLLTDYWKRVREAVKERDRHQCVQCKSLEILQVHHLTYDHHGDEMNHLEDLVTLCFKCHQEKHAGKRKARPAALPDLSLSE
jgi:5-methylcytosine-specific restriction endonuclease McrA